MSTKKDTPFAGHSHQRMRVIATGLLLCMALLFLVAVINEPAHPLFSWLRAFAEAAMVGALADWYAVTALFRHPAGLPIPHTAIISANRDRIAARIGSLTQRQLMTPASIARLIASWRLPEELTAVLLDQQRRGTVVAEMAALLIRALEACEDAAMQRFLRHVGVKVIQGVTVAPLAGRLLSTFLHSSQRDRLLGDLLSTLHDGLESNRSLLGGLIAEKLPWSRLLNFMKLDRAVADKVLDALSAALRTMRDDPADGMRRALIERLELWAEWLTRAPGASTHEAALKEKLLTNDTLLEFFDECWHGLKQWLSDDLRADRSETRAALDAALADLGQTLRTDAELRAMLDRSVLGLAEDLAARHSDKIAELVTDTIREWPLTHMIETIEREVGTDLQYIRINGTVVGGLVGLGLYAVGRLIRNG